MFTPRLFLTSQKTLLIAATVLSGWLVATSAGPATATSADAGTISLNPSHVGSTAAGFGEKDCTDFTPKPAEGMDGWHFVAPSKQEFVSLHLTFEYPDGAAFAIVIPPSEPASGGWGYIRQDKPKHAYVYTPAGVKLTSGTAEVETDGDLRGGPNAKFNLSHTCVSTPTLTPTIPPVTQPPTPKPTKTPHPTKSPRPTKTPHPTTTAPTSTAPQTSTVPTSTTVAPVVTKKPALPVTGAAVTGYALGGAALLAGGIALIVFSRRKAKATMAES